MVIMSIFFLTLLMSLQTSLLAGSYNANLLLTWMGGHCKNLGEKCDRVKYEQWDHQSFTIHGLRLSRPTSKRYGDFDFNTLRENERLLDKMYNYWPPQPAFGENPHFLWNYQWQKYGHRFAEMMTIQKGKRYTSSEYQSTFFTVTMQIYESINVMKLRSNQYFRNHPFGDVPSYAVYFICGKDRVLTGIKICLTIDMTYSKFETNYRNCGQQQKETSCPSHNTLYDYRHVDIKINPMSDEYFQELEDSNKLVYYPQQEQKEDDKIERIVIDTMGHDSHESEIRIVKDKDTIGRERAELEQEAKKQYSHYQGWQEYYGDVASDQVMDVVITTSIVVSLFWISLIVCAVKCWQKMKKKQCFEVKKSKEGKQNGLFEKEERKLRGDKAVIEPRETEGNEKTILMRKNEKQE